MQGITLFLHSFRQITGNFAMAIKVSWWFIAFLAVFFIIVFSSFIENAGFIGLVLLLGMMGFTVWGMSLIAVVWHRYVLLNEQPQKGIPFRAGLKVWPYFWHSVLLAMILLGGGIVISLAVNVVMLNGSLLGEFIKGIFVTAVFFHFALILPALSLGKPLKLADALRYSQKFTGAIIGLAAVSFGLNLAVLTVINLFFGLPIGQEFLVMVDGQTMINEALTSLPAYLVVIGALQWFSFMLNISILTTLYGLIVEKREIF